MANQDQDKISFNVVHDDIVAGSTEAMDVRAFDADPFHEADNAEDVNEIPVPADETDQEPAKPAPKKRARKE